MSLFPISIAFGVAQQVVVLPSVIPYFILDQRSLTIKDFNLNIVGLLEGGFRNFFTNPRPEYDNGTGYTKQTQVSENELALAI
jgi:hypothetical protein